jgi:hypothetical protein
MTARNVATDLDPAELPKHVKVVRLYQRSVGRSGMAEENTSVARGDVSSVQGTRSCGLSVRALNVLKLLAAEITGECPPRENWTPSSALLREITAKRLIATRNCGPLTACEILRWADSRGVSIPPPFHAGKSLAETWHGLEVKFMSGELTKAEVTEALDKSVRRWSSKIPITVQKILLKLLNAAGEQSGV